MKRFLKFFSRSKLAQFKGREDEIRHDAAMAGVHVSFATKMLVLVEREQQELLKRQAEEGESAAIKERLEELNRMARQCRQQMSMMGRLQDVLTRLLARLEGT